VTFGVAWQFAHQARFLFTQPECRADHFHERRGFRIEGDFACKNLVPLRFLEAQAAQARANEPGLLLLELSWKCANPYGFDDAGGLAASGSLHCS
jgi:hypothetical protein